MRFIRRYWIFKKMSLILRFVVNLLNDDQKRSIKGRLPESLKKMIKRGLAVDHDFNRVGQFRYRLLNLGFKEKAYADLKALAMDDSNPKRQIAAAWELALWHADQYTVKDAKESLKFLAVVGKNIKNKDYTRQIAILEAECLELLGDTDNAKRNVLELVKIQKHSDIYLALANLEILIEDRMKWINKALHLSGISPIKINLSESLPYYDRIESINITKNKTNDGPKVTVIIPVYNAERVLHTALNSVTSQTWKNLEILVVDDSSNDRTTEIVEEYMKRDTRIKLLKASTNGGPYVARNLALQVAAGEYVTCHDADDWSHSQKLEIQIKHLIKNPRVIGNTSEQARATSDMKFYRRGKPGSYIFSNMSSFMFRREPVMKEIGYWDSVRFGADSEFIRRIKKKFGEKSVVEIETGPLSFQRQAEGSLTSSGYFGYHGFFMGARKEYFESFVHYHNKAKSLYYGFPQEKRPFAIPEPMWSLREPKITERRHFDVIIASDFRLDGGSTLSSVEEIKAQKRFGLRTGLIQMARYDYPASKKINPMIRQLLDSDLVQMIVYGEKVSCDLLILRYPPILQERQKYIPDVDAKEIKVIINQSPMSDYSISGELRYDIGRSKLHLEEYFGSPGIWYPIGPLIREALYKYHSKELKQITLSDDDWVNIIDVDEWRRKERPGKGTVTRIGRHSRDSVVKWPENIEDLENAYPESDEYEIHILGGASTPEKTLGYMPTNWHVIDFGEISPKEFLASLDVFVYFTHSEWVESFGRVIIEAMAVGVPVIIPEQYRELFKEAAIYAKSNEVRQKVDELMKDSGYYESQVQKAFNYIEQHFGHRSHQLRLECVIKSSSEVLNE